MFLRDLGAIRMDLDRVESLDLSTLGGADTVAVDNMDGTHIGQADIDLSSQGAGDRQVDSVTVNGTNRADHIDVDPTFDDASVPAGPSPSGKPAR